MGIPAAAGPAVLRQAPSKSGAVVGIVVEAGDPVVVVPVVPLTVVVEAGEPPIGVVVVVVPPIGVVVVPPPSVSVTSTLAVAL